MNNSFFTSDQKVINDLQELHKLLDNNLITDESFNYHHQNGHFSNWIKDVFNNEKLAKEVTRIKTKKAFKSKVEKYI